MYYQASIRAASAGRGSPMPSLSLGPAEGFCPKPPWPSHKAPCSPQANAERVDIHSPFCHGVKLVYTHSLGNGLSRRQWDVDTV
eukprot:scaffold203_cov386-Prasinococcus_capsulatus_cf.AAC.3